MHLPVPSDSSGGRVGGRGRARRLLLCVMPMAVTGLALRGLVAGASALRSSALSRRGPLTMALGRSCHSQPTVHTRTQKVAWSGVRGGSPPSQRMSGGI